MRKIVGIALLLFVVISQIAWTSAGFIMGQVRLQGPNALPGTTIEVCGRIVPSTLNGRFYVACQPGTYTLIARHSGFLPARAEVTVTHGRFVDLGTTVLLGGDVNGDAMIEIGDSMIVETFIRLSPTLRYAGSLFPPPLDPDINDDGWVDSTDWQYTFNWQLSPTMLITGPTPW